MRELCYQPNHAARSLKSRRSHTLGVIISDLTNPFFPLVIRGAEDAATQRNNILNIFNTDDKLHRELESFKILRSRRVDGILVVVSPAFGDAGHLRHLLDSGVPVVCMDRAPETPRLDSVVVDNSRGALMCVRHLANLGHKAISMITGPIELQTSRERVHGYRAALAGANIEFRPNLFRIGDFRLDSGYRLAKELCLENPRPTALFVANGTMGLGAVKAVQELGLRCPDDVAIAIFDDVPGADVLRPRLTVVSQPAYEIGFRAAQLLLDRIEGHETSKSPVTVKLTPELIIRESTLGPWTLTPAEKRAPEVIE